MSKEKRKAERLDSQLFVNFESLSRTALGRGVVFDTSLSGLGVETETDFNLGEEVVCQIEIPLSVRAKVVRRITTGQLKRYGLQFSGQSFFDKIVLKKLLKGPRKTKKIV